MAALCLRYETPLSFSMTELEMKSETEDFGDDLSDEALDRVEGAGPDGAMRCAGWYCAASGR